MLPIESFRVRTVYIDRLVQGRHNSSVLAPFLHYSIDMYHMTFTNKSFDSHIA